MRVKVVTVGTLPPPPPLRTKWTRRVPHLVLIGHAASLDVKVVTVGTPPPFRGRPPCPPPCGSP